MIKTNSVVYDTSATPITLGTTWTDYSTVYNTNPQTTAAWTWDEVNALQAGVALRQPKTSGGGTRESDCTMVWVVVDYTVVTPPTVTTQAATNVEATTATGNGNITAIGGATVTRRGFCYMVGTSGDPTTANSVAYDDGSFTTGAYTKEITGLSTGTNYRVRAYANNAGGTGYGTTVQILTKPAAPTDVAATDGTYADKVTVTWTKSTGATGYRVYRDAEDISGLLGDVATYDDTGAAVPTITPGTASASDGTSSDYVALSLSGQSANTTNHTYKVVAVNATGESADSSTDTGYRSVGSLTYQWQRSAADSDADYSKVVGTTTASYNDTGAPADGSGRYYKCILNATGASQQTSTADRGYRSIAPDISNTPNSKDFGVLAEGATGETAINFFTVTNNSGYAVNITISGTDLTGGTAWTLSDTATPGTDTYGLKAGLDDADDQFDIIVKKSSPNYLVENLANSASQDWGLKIWAPTTFTGGGENAGAVTLTATAA